MPTPYDQFIQHAIAGQGFSILAVLPVHTAALIALPFHHRDPFDRLLVAQSVTEPMQLISNDETLDAYAIQRVW